MRLCRSLSTAMLVAAVLLAGGPRVGAQTPVPAPAPAPAQEPKPGAEPAPVRAAKPLTGSAQALIDEFVALMPQSPSQLRRPEVRKELAPKALPLLRRIQAFVTANPASELGQRIHEFTVYALVLDDAELRAGLLARSRAGDREAALLLGAADLIAAGEGPQRAEAVAACARGLRRRPEGAKADLDPVTARCAVFCLGIAADLTADEARRLADAGPGDELAQRLRDIADAASRDPRRLLDQPFVVRGAALDGGTFDSTSLRGKVVLVDFWATWCGPCVRALPTLVALRRKHGDAGLAIVGVSSDRERAKLTAFLTEHKEMDWPQLFAGEGTKWHPLATECGITAIPRLFLIDRKGVLRSVDAAADLDALVRRYLAE